MNLLPKLWGQMSLDMVFGFSSPALAGRGRCIPRRNAPPALRRSFPKTVCPFGGQISYYLGMGN
jgi:hypothetical protein